MKKLVVNYTSLKPKATDISLVVRNKQLNFYSCRILQNFVKNGRIILNKKFIINGLLKKRF